jgi:aromatic ring hydroxylase
MDDKIEVRERAELIFKGVIPEGEYNTPMEAEAKEDGLMIDEYVLIPWEWIDAARLRLSTSDLRE